jgi:hypothetical protein
LAIDLKPTLETALSDEANSIWTTAELDTTLQYALDQINMVRQRQVRDTIPLVTDTDSYTLTNVYSVVRVDLLDSDNKVVRTLAPGTWEVWGDNLSAGQTLYINPAFARTGYSIRVHGYGPYDFTTNTPDSMTQATIVALARAECLRRVMNDRARFRQWATSNPRSDSSVGELIGLLNEADSEAQRLLRSIKLIKRPAPGRF